MTRYVRPTGRSSAGEPVAGYANPVRTMEDQ